MAIRVGIVAERIGIVAMRVRSAAIRVEIAARRTGFEGRQVGYVGRPVESWARAGIIPSASLFRIASRQDSAASNSDSFPLPR